MQYALTFFSWEGHGLMPSQRAECEEPAPPPVHAYISLFIIIFNLRDTRKEKRKTSIQPTDTQVILRIRACLS